MKKGSRAQRCKMCGKIIFWKVPVKQILGILEVENKEVIPYKYAYPYGKQEHFPYTYGAYLCMDCYKKWSEKSV